ncbi:MAG: FAD-binding oxidoreductase [Hyphomicrobiales bacterium]|nr:FAD-binding oxidoreductase [Hyphomicrobiales bacterium]
MAVLTDSDLFASDFKAEPYWWMAAPRPETVSEALPASADVAVVGSGYTGLSAALTLARAGRDVVVLEAGPAGFGASSRNAGFVGKTFKHSFSSLLDGAGENYAISAYRELDAAFDHVTGLIADERIACHYTRCGRYMAANSPAHFESMTRELDLKHKHLGYDSEMLSAKDQRSEFASNRYHGGAIIPDLASLHPGLYHLGLLERTRAAGARVFGNTPVTGISRDADGFDVATLRGTVKVRNVALATNGYTGRATPWLRRRVIPFRGFMIATEELDEALLSRILPNARTMHDFNNNLVYIRRAPDTPRLLLGAQTGTMTDDLPKMARRLHAVLSELVPEMKGVRLSRAWNGFGAGTFDLYPHVGEHDGIHYALGYCFAGVPMGTYLGHKMALSILDDPAADTIFAGRPFETRWWYRGTPWFLPAYVGRLNWLDKHGR